MSWLARSLANSLRLDDDEENDVAPATPHDPSPTAKEQYQQQIQIQNEETESLSSSSSSPPEEEAQSRGVKEDLSELKQTLTRQLWGVASFLAPPPAHSDHLSGNQSLPNLDQFEGSDQSVLRDEEDPPDSGEVSDIRGDFSEIGGRFQSGVSGISKMASNYFPFGSEESEEEIEEENEELELQEDDLGGGAVGITDEVLAFAGNIAMHPETWLDFPLDEEEDLDDFDMSEAQQEHALAIERLAPRLAALRIELCPCHMTESYFWKVYFVLLHSRINKHDADILSTPQVMEARAMWMQELQKQTKPESDWYGRSTSYLSDRTILQEDLLPDSSSDGPSENTLRTYAYGPTTSTITDYETEKHPVEHIEMQFIDKSVIEEKPVIKTTSTDFNYEDDEDDWPEEEDSELVGYIRTTICVGNEDEISFSDLEDDDNSVPIKSKIVSKGLET